MSKDPEESVAAKEKRSGRRRPHRERTRGPYADLARAWNKASEAALRSGWETGVNREV